MKIKYIHIKNFRILKDTKIDLDKDLSVIIGKNNTGKTSLLLILDKFLSNNPHFVKEDFNKDIWKITNPFISLELCIEYNDIDDLLLLNPFFCSLDTDDSIIFLEFRYETSKKSFTLDNLNKGSKLNDNFQLNVYSKEKKEEQYFNKCDIKDVLKLINFKYIRASRCIKEQENNNISNLARNYYEKNSKDKPNDSYINKFNEIILKVNTELTNRYKDFFNPFFNTMSDFNFKAINGQNNLSVKSNIEINSLVSDSTSIIYKENNEDCEIPESYNGLGYTNLLFLCLKIKDFCDMFKEEQKTINLLFIEEPEAHMHPQMQYIFMENITEFITKQNISNLQNIITSHSPYIIAKTYFSNLKYFNFEKDSIKASNFNELEKKENKDNIKFIKKYLEIGKYEMFFADYIIIVEGNTEKILMPYFIKKINKDLLNKNISIIQIGGAYAHKFKDFLDFLKIKTLIITDLDFKIDEDTKKTIEGYDNIKNKFTTNQSLITLTNGNNIIENIIEKIKCFNKNNNLHLITQTKYEDGYICRSFEEDFIKSNFDFFKENKKNILILNDIKFNKELEFSIEDIQNIKNKIGDKKIDFALNIMFYIEDNTKENNFNVPKYIEDGIIWLSTN